MPRARAAIEMNKNFLIAGLVFALALCVALNVWQYQQIQSLQSELKEAASEYLVSDTHIEVENGQKFTIILESNPTTGFGWQLAKPLDESIVKFIDSEFRTLATKFPPPPGTGGIEIWTFEAIGVGTTEIFMEYLRPWEDAPPEKEQTFTVIVK